MLRAKTPSPVVSSSSDSEEEVEELPRRFDDRGRPIRDETGRVKGVGVIYPTSYSEPESDYERNRGRGRKRRSTALRPEFRGEEHDYDDRHGRDRRAGRGGRGDGGGGRTGPGGEEVLEMVRTVVGKFQTGGWKGLVEGVVEAVGGLEGRGARRR